MFNSTCNAMPLGSQILSFRSVTSFLDLNFWRSTLRRLLYRWRHHRTGERALKLITTRTPGAFSHYRAQHIPEVTLAFTLSG